MEGKIEEARNLVETLQSLLNPVSVIVTSGSNNHIISPAITSQGTSHSQVSSQLPLPSVSTPYDIHQRLFSYKRKSKNHTISSKLTSCKKPKKEVPWSHTFVCLADKDLEHVPTDYSLLTANGLGKAKIQLLENSTAMDVHEAILDQFPKLKEYGYELLRTVDNTKRLCVLTPPPEGYTAHFLKKVLGQANCYIRPLLHNIELLECPAVTSGVQIPESVPRIKCEKCSELVPMIVFREHLDCCQKVEEVEIVAVEPPEAKDSLIDSAVLVDNIDIDLGSLTYTYINPPRSPISSSSSSPLPSFHDVFNKSDVDVSENISGTSRSINSLLDVIQQLRNDNGIVVFDNEEDLSVDQKMYIDVRRDFVLKDALRECKKNKFSPKKLLKVKFVGESGIDTGGPRREFWELLISACIKEYCVGEGNEVTFVQNTAALQNLEFKHLGMYFAMSVLQEGRCFPSLHPCVYNYMCTGKYIGGQMNDDGIMSSLVRSLVEQLRKCDSEESAITLFDNREDYLDLLCETGYKKNYKKLKMHDINEIIEILKCHCFKLAIPEINQFCEGLEMLNVFTYIKRFPDIMIDLFVDDGKRLTSYEFKELFRTIYSEKNTPERPLEEATYITFVDFLEKCEGGDVCVNISDYNNTSAEPRRETVTLEDILKFWTGTSRVPIEGFHATPSLVFLHGDDNVLSTASTCALQLRLPTKYAYDPKEFEEKLILSIKGNVGFGLI